MGKIYLKTKYDKDMGMDIPHSINQAVAMYGFRTLGAQIIPYHSLDHIYDEVRRDDIVLDYILQCNEIFKKFGARNCHVPDYPDVLKPFLGRDMWIDRIGDFASDSDKWSKGYFIKPIKAKAFTGKRVSSLSDLVGCGNYDDDYEILVSQPLEIMAEWRSFIYYDEILDVRPYGLIMDRTRNSYMYHYDEKVLANMMKAFVTWDERPSASSMDICVTSDGRTLLVECNDAYALGCYGLPDIYYAKMISARWSQIMAVQDEYCFL